MGSAQSTTSAAVIIVILTIVLVLYVMLIPPDDRSALLNDNAIVTQNTVSPSNGGSGTTSGATDRYLFQGPGFVDQVDEDSIIRLPSVQLKTRTNSVIFAEDDLFLVEESFTQSETKVIPFTIKDPDAVDSVYMSFLTKSSQGRLIIELNGVEIFDRELDGNIAPVKLSSALLKESNALVFKTQEIGWLFWKKNSHLLEDFKVFGDVTTTSYQSSYTTFELGASAYQFLRRATLDFYPSCDQNDVGLLTIAVNGNVIFKQLPDCKVLNKYDMPQQYLNAGVNTIGFTTEKDSYLIDRIEVETKQEENDNLLYYFDLSKDLFTITNDPEFICGEFDGVCPDSCGEDQDRDCCFNEYSGDGFWCDIPTTNANDRCVGRVDQYNVNLCKSGYEDRSGDPHEDFDNLCGDDTDGVCSIGCSIEYDKDCCLSDDSGRFWCDNMPITGQSGICKTTLTNDECSLCPGGYEGERNDPSCSYESRNPTDEEARLISDYDVELTLEFVDDNQRKRGILRVNGYEFSFDTWDSEFVRDIDTFVEDGSNYVQVLPQNAFNLVSVEIRVTDD